MRHKGKHRAGKYSLTVADIKAALHAERDWNDALYCGPVTVPEIVTYLTSATGGGGSGVVGRIGGQSGTWITRIGGAA